MANCNEDNCTCLKKDCERHGKCCECINFHLNMGNKVSCMRDKVEENKQNEILREHRVVCLNRPNRTVFLYLKTGSIPHLLLHCNIKLCTYMDYQAVLCVATDVQICPGG